jgi:hypothetical protein
MAGLGATWKSFQFTRRVVAQAAAHLQLAQGLLEQQPPASSLVVVDGEVGGVLMASFSWPMPFTRARLQAASGGW